MNELLTDVSPGTPSIPNGSGAAAILSTGIGTFIFAVIAFAGDKSAAFKAHLVFYKPTGPLSGVVAIGVAVWLASWVLLGFLWGKTNVSVRGICASAMVLLVLGLLLTFPPIVDLL